MKIKKVVIVGGGAGGLELVARLSRECERKKSIDLILVDQQLKHVWKPLYHEVAAGTYHYYSDEIDYISFSFEKKFKYIAGSLKNISSKSKFILIKSLFDEKEIQLEYDVLILSLGSTTNNFNIPGVKEHCLFLDSFFEAELCNKALIKHIILSAQYKNHSTIDINIVGGGATGIELAAEINDALLESQRYSKTAGLFLWEFKINIIESSEKILSMLPEPVSQKIIHFLQSRNIRVLTNTKITEVKSNGVITSKREFISSDVTIWAGGVMGLANNITHPLETNKLNQFMVRQTLQTSLDDSIFAFGDCASCPQHDKQGNKYFVPPRAQAAHQQAKLLSNSILDYLENKKLSDYYYKDYGSLISLSRWNAVGNFMGRITKNFYIQGWLARLAYGLLYKQHLFIIKGARYVVFSLFANIFIKKQRPAIKLH